MEQWGRVRAGSCVRMRERRDEDEMRELSKYCVRRREVVKALHSSILPFWPVIAALTAVCPHIYASLTSVSEAKCIALR